MDSSCKAVGYRCRLFKAVRREQFSHSRGQGLRVLSSVFLDLTQFAFKGVLTCLLLMSFLTDPNITSGPVFGGQVTFDLPFVKLGRRTFVPGNALKEFFKGGGYDKCEGEREREESDG